MSALWLRELDRARVLHLQEVLNTVGDLIDPVVYRDIHQAILKHRNPPLIRNGRKP